MSVTFEDDELDLIIYLTKHYVANKREKIERIKKKFGNNVDQGHLMRLRNSVSFCDRIIGKSQAMKRERSKHE